MSLPTAFSSYKSHRPELFILLKDLNQQGDSNSVVFHACFVGLRAAGKRKDTITTDVTSIAISDFRLGLGVRSSLAAGACVGT